MWKPGGRFSFSIVHPAFGEPVAKWEPRVAGTILIMDRGKLYKKADNYFPAREVRFRMWPTAPTETINYDRPLSDYAHTVRAAGYTSWISTSPSPQMRCWNSAIICASTSACRSS